MGTQTVKGGNTDTVYKEGTQDKSMMAVAVHPDVCKCKFRYGRHHHICDFKRFKQVPVKK